MNIQISKEVVEEYHKTHSYYGKDIFVCGDMANDVWNMLKTRGINAKIQIGNVDKDDATLFESNHAWVLAEITADKWLALETTGGYLVYSKDNPRYYKGWNFYTPKQFKEYLQLLTEYNDKSSKYNEAITRYNEVLPRYKEAASRYEDAVARYNQLVSQYNQAGILTKYKLSEGVKTQAAIVETQTAAFEAQAAIVKTQAAIVEQRTNDLNEVTSKMKALLTY